MNFMIMRNSKSLTCTEQENQPLISICMLCGLRLSLNFHSRRRRACKKWHGNVDGLNFSPFGIKDNFLFTRVVPKCINHTKIPPPPLPSSSFTSTKISCPSQPPSFLKTRDGDRSSVKEPQSVWWPRIRPCYGVYYLITCAYLISHCIDTNEVPLIGRLVNPFL